MNGFNGNLFPKKELLKLTINKMQEDTETFISSLLKGLNISGKINEEGEQEGEQEILWESNIDDNKFIKSIIMRIDWAKFENSEYGQDIFFNNENTGLYSSLKDDLSNDYKNNNDFKKIDIKSENWDNHYWNDSIAKLLQLLYQRLDPKGIVDYEDSGLLIEYIEEDKENTIDTDHLRGAIKPSGAKAELRITDIRNADAGNSFDIDDEMYWFGMFFDPGSKLICTADGIEPMEIKMDYVLLQQIGYNIITKALGGDQISGEELTQALADYNEKGNQPEKDFDWKQKKVTCVLEGTYQIFKVAENTWVVPWYNIDGETYKKVRNEDKKLSVLTDSLNLDFTCNNEEQEKKSHWIRLIMPRNKRKVEVEDLNRNFWVIAQVLVGISIYLFDEDGPLNQMIRGLLKEIAGLWENTLYLWTQAALMSQRKYYDKVHTEVVFLSYNELYPNLKYDNFDHLTGLNNNDITYYLQSYAKQYTNYNLVFLPCIRLNNYESNYYSKIIFPGIWIFDRNTESPTWKVISFTGENVIDSADFADQIYGIKEEEEKYTYIAPLSDVRVISGKQSERYYGLIRDEINLTAEIVNENGNISIKGTVQIKLYDAGWNLINGSQKNYIYDTNNIDNTFSSAMNNKVLINSAAPTIPSHITGEKNISYGYYQGELLSTYEDSRKRSFNIITLDSALLEPVFEDTSYLVAHYPEDKDEESEYAKLREKDNAVLSSIIAKTFEYFEIEEKIDFWTEEKLSYFSNGTYYDGENDGTKLTTKTTRENAPLSWWSLRNDNPVKKYYETEKDQLSTGQQKWMSNMNNRFKNDKMNEDSILYIEGQRDGEWKESETKGVNFPDTHCEEYFPYDEDVNKRGFAFPILSFYRGSSTVTTGAAIGFKTNDKKLVTAYYSNHSAISDAAVADIYNPFVPSQFDANKNHCIFRYKDSQKKTEEGAWKPYRSDDILNCPIDLIHTSAGASTTVEEQILVMRRSSEEEITENNWRVVLIRQNQNTPYFYDGETKLNWEEYYQSIENLDEAQIYEGIIRRKALELEEEFIQKNGRIPTVKELGDDLINTFKDKTDPYAKYFNEQQEKPQWKKDEVWDEDTIGYFAYLQAILRGNYPPLFQEQCRLYKEDSSWDSKIKSIWNSLTTKPINLWNSYEYKDSEGLTFSNRTYVSGRVGNTIGIYVFGPEQGNTNTYLYGKRAIRRDKNKNFYIDDSENPNALDVDRLRQGYTVISNSKATVNYEAYKSMGNKGTKNPYYSPNSLNNHPDDKLSYNINWDEEIMDWDKDN